MGHTRGFIESTVLWEQSKCYFSWVLKDKQFFEGVYEEGVKRYFGQRSYIKKGEPL